MLRRLFIVLLILTAAMLAGWLSLRRDDIPYDILETKYAAETSRFLTLADGQTVHYRDEGPRDAPVIIMLHGFSSSLITWDDWAADLATDYRIIRLDLTGHGLTRVPDDYEFSIQNYVAFVRAVLSNLEIDKPFILAGSSMGGNITWRYALEHPEDVKGMVLVGAAGLSRSGEAENTPLIFKLIGNPILGSIVQDLDLSHFVEDGLRQSFLDDSIVDEAMVDRYTDFARAPGHRGVLLDISTTTRSDNEQAEKRLSEIAVPTLILHGRYDNLVPVEFAGRYEAAIPNAEAIIYENAGHLPQEEIPAQSTEDLKAFLATLLPAPETSNSEAQIEPAPSDAEQ